MGNCITACYYDEIPQQRRISWVWNEILEDGTHYANCPLCGKKRAVGKYPPSWAVRTFHPCQESYWIDDKEYHERVCPENI